MGRLGRSIARLLVAILGSTDTDMTHGRRRTLLYAAASISIMALFAVVSSVASAATSWTPLGPPGGWVYSLDVSPQYAGDGTAIAGIMWGSGDNYITTDGGASWSSIGGGLPSAGCNDVEFSPDFGADGTVFIQLQNNGVYRSTDGGSNWTYSGVPGNRADIEASPDFASDGLVLAATGAAFSSGSGVKASHDGGSSWESTMSPLGTRVSRIAFSPGYSQDHTLFAVADDAGIAGFYKSTDGGESWNRIDPGFYEQNTDIAVAPDFASSGTLFLGAGKNLHVSHDGGASWDTTQTFTQGAYITDIAVSPDFAQDDTVFVSLGFDWGGSDTSNGAVHKSTDGGQTWQAVDSGLADQQVSCMAISPGFATDAKLLLGTRSGGIYQTWNSGTNWDQYAQGIQERSAGEVAVSPIYSVDGVAFATTPEGLMVTRNHGTTWAVAFSTRVSSVAVSPGFQVDRTVFATVSDATVGGLYMSQDAGVTWSKHTGVSDVWMKSVSLSPTYLVDGIVFLVGNIGKVYRSSDFGASFSTVGTLPDANAGGPIVVSPDYASDLTLACATPNDGVIMSTNGGGSWSIATPPPPADDYAYEVVMSPSFKTDDTLMCGVWTDGAYLSRDRGQTWQKTGASEFGSVSVVDLAVSERDGLVTFAAATASGATWVSLDEGATWELLALGSGDLQFSASFASDSELFSSYKAFSRVLVPTLPPDTTPPTTTISRVPFYPDGSNNWFTTAPTISFTRDEPGVTYYQLDSTSTAGWQVYSGPQPAPEGFHHVYFFSVDSSNNTETVNVCIGTGVDSQPPSAPSNVVATAPSTSYIDLAWDASVDATPGSGLWYYSIYDSGDNLLTATTSTVTEHRQSGLQPDTEYTFYVTAKDIAGNESSASTQVSARTKPIADITAPTTTLILDPPAPDGSNSWYVTSPSIELQTDEPATTNYQVDGAGPWYEYSTPFPVPEGEHFLNYASYDATGNVEATQTCAGVMVDLTDPATVTATLGTVGANSAQFSWTASSDSGSGLSSYAVYRQGSSNPLATVTGLSTTLSHLTPGASYSLVVRAVDVAGRVSADSNTISFTTEVSDTTWVDPGAGSAGSTPGGSSIVFDEVTNGGTLDIAPVENPHPNPPAFRMLRNSYFDITFDGDFTGFYTITIAYDESDLQGSNESNLKLFHRKDNKWEDITVSVDTVNNTITGRADSFSGFGVGASSSSGSAISSASSDWSLLVLALVGVGLLVAGVRDRRASVVA